MIRWTLLALLVLNLALAAWSLGIFTRSGWGPADGREPQRLERQVRPEAISITAPALATSGASDASLPAAIEASMPASSPASHSRINPP